MTEQEKKWIIFDVMGVIFTVGDDTNDLLVPFVQNRNKTISRERINEIYLEASLGHITSAEFWKLAGVADSDHYPETEREYLDTCLTIDERFLETVARLKENYRLAILSNDVDEWGAYLREKYGINEVVEFSIISGAVGCRKPSEEIYRMVLERTGAEPRDCLFVDDRDKNLVPAGNVGMNVVRFLRDDTGCKLADVETVDSFADLEKKLEFIWEK